VREAVRVAAAVKVGEKVADGVWVAVAGLAGVTVGVREGVIVAVAVWVGE